ncbi:MAG: ANTAR domain-containing protein [Eubacterium sp.]|nr:ANTAR domain-containing protein [Eubacterium sp.]
MDVSVNSYSALIVSGNEQFNIAISSMLPKGSFHSISIAKSIASAKREVAQKDFDFIIINSPLSDDLGMRFAIDCSNSNKSIVLFIIQNEFYNQTYAKLSDYGVFTLPKPLSKQSTITSLRWMLTAKKRLESAEKKSVKMEDKMEEIRLVNKAKWLLISKEGLLEPEAHKFLEKEAMNRCITKKEVATQIIEKYS